MSGGEIPMEYQSYEKFEYQVVEFPPYSIIQELNLLGKRGWHVLMKLDGMNDNSKFLMERKLSCIETIDDGE